MSIDLTTSTEKPIKKSGKKLTCLIDGTISSIAVHSLFIGCLFCKKQITLPEEKKGQYVASDLLHLMTDSCIQAGVDLELFFETCDQANGFLIEPGECDKCGPDSQWGVIVYFAVNVEVTKIRGHYLPNCRPKTVSFKCQFDKLFKVGLPEEDTATKAFLLMEMTSDNEDMKRQAISLLGLDTELAFCGSSKPTASHTIDIDNLYLKRIQDISTEWDASELSQTFLNFGEQLKLYAGTENNHKRRRLDDE